MKAHTLIMNGFSLANNERNRKTNRTIWKMDECVSHWRAKANEKSESHINCDAVNIKSIIG